MAYKLDRRETYFMLLWDSTYKSGFSLNFSEKMSNYAYVYHRLNTCEKWADDFGFWYMDGETERRTMLGLAAYFGTPKEFSVYVTNDLNSVEVHDFEKTQSMLFELVLTKFKDELKLANSKRLEKLTIREIRQLALQEEVRLPAGKRKAELIEEYNRQLTEEETRMTKTTSVEDAVLLVKAAVTMDDVKTVLKGFTKALISEVYARMYDCKLPVGWKKSDQINAFVRAEEERREKETFKGLTVAEKVQEMTGKDYYKNIAKIDLCTDAELEEMAEVLGAKLDAKKEELSYRYALLTGVNEALVKMHYKKEDKPMSKKVSLEDAKAAVHGATTPEALRGVLECFNKGQIAGLFRTMFAPASISSGMEKEAMIEIFIKTEMRTRDIAAFKELNVEGRIRQLVNIEESERSYYFNACTDDEIVKMGSVFGINKSDRDMIEIILDFRLDELKTEERLTQLLLAV